MEGGRGKRSMSTLVSVVITRVTLFLAMYLYLEFSFKPSCCALVQAELEAIVHV